MMLARTPSKRPLAPGPFWMASALLLAALPASGQSRDWIQRFGTPAHDFSTGAAPDGSGGLYLGGITEGSLGGPNAGSEDGWLARFDRAGNRLWIRQLGTGAHDRVNAVAEDGSGGAFVAGRTLGSLGGANAGSFDAWLARYDGVGNLLWLRQLGGSAGEYTTGAAPDAAGGVYLCGFADSPSGPWMARYDGAGNQLWIRSVGTSPSDWTFGVAPDAAGGVFLCGISSGYGASAWLARYDGAGNLIWIRPFGANLASAATIAADGSGGAYLGGSTIGSFGGPYAGGWSDAWVGRWDGAGNLLWVRQIGTSGFDDAWTLAPDGSDGVYVGGWTEGSLFGPNAEWADAWLARYDGAGNRLWGDQIGTQTNDATQALAPDGSGGVFASGAMGGTPRGFAPGGWQVWLAHYDAGCGAVSVYCTAKTTSTGCTPAIGSAGTPSKSGGPGTFAVTLSDTRPGQPHLLFYSVGTARSAVPFQGGFLCMEPPLRRTAVELTSNAGECTSGMVKDLGALLASSVFIGAGDVIRGEWWGRDTPGNPSLSDAIELTVCP